MFIRESTRVVLVDLNWHSCVFERAVGWDELVLRPWAG